MSSQDVSHDIRKTALSVETTWHERGPRLEKPLLVGTAIAVIRNPFAGRFEPDLMPFQASLRELGRELATRLIAQLGGAAQIEAYGKGIIVGEDGELEHGAVWHEAGGQGMREVLGQPKAIVPAAKTHRRSGHAAHGSARAHPRRLCPQPFRHRGDDAVGFTTARRARIRARDGDRRPASRAHRRPRGIRDLRARRTALTGAINARCSGNARNRRDHGC
ncbi:hypothetical protein ACVWZ6_004155 [Bradyrhizobium sp. GM6.1]